MVIYAFRHGVSNRLARGAFVSRSGSGDCVGEVQGEACGGLVAEGRVGPRGVVVGDPGGDQITGTEPRLRHLNEEIFESLADARRKLALWRYDYNHVRPRSSLGGLSPAEARRALEQFDGSAPGALAQPPADQYQIEGLSL